MLELEVVVALEVAQASPLTLHRSLFRSRSQFHEFTNSLHCTRSSREQLEGKGVEGSFLMLLRAFLIIFLNWSTFSVSLCKCNISSFVPTPATCRVLELLTSPETGVKYRGQVNSNTPSPILLLEHSGPTGAAQSRRRTHAT